MRGLDGAGREPDAGRGGGGSGRGGVPWWPLPLMRGVASLCGVWGAVAGLVVSVGASARQCWSCRRRRVSWDLVVVERW